MPMRGYKGEGRVEKSERGSPLTDIKKPGVSPAFNRRYPLPDSSEQIVRVRNHKIH